MQDFICSCCGSPDHRPKGSYALPMGGGPGKEPGEMSYPLAECARCGHVMAHPRPSDIDIKAFYGSQSFWKGHGVDDGFDQMDWFETVTANASLWERFNRAGNQLDYILDHTNLDQDARIIDLGSGYSPFLFHCKQRGFTNLFALEPSDSICSFLKSQGVSTFPTLLEDFIADENVPQFDLMIISHTVEHLVDPGLVIKGLGAKLSKAGVLYVDVPFQDHLRPFHQGLHFHFFNKPSMRALLDTCGLKAERIESDRFGLLEKAIISILYFVYRLKYKGQGGVSANSSIEGIHRALWRPLKRLLNLKINIFISSMDLRVLIRR